MKALPVPDKNRLERDYEDLGSLTALANHYNVSATTILNWFNKLGIKTLEQRIKGIK